MMIGNQILNYGLCLFIAVCTLFACNGNDDVSIPWESNRYLQWNRDSMTILFYEDTLINYGPLKYVCLHYNSGRQFYGVDVMPKVGETHSDYLDRLSSAKRNYHEHCSNCGDLDFWKGTEQNLEIITLYSLIRHGKFEEAKAFIQEKEKSWSNSSGYTDLYLALLLKTIGREQIEQQLNRIASIDKDDSIKIEDCWMRWQPIAEYNYYQYGKTIHWKAYIATTLDRIEKFDI